MSRSIAFAALLALFSLPMAAQAQHGLPVDALPFDGALVQQITVPDGAELPVRVVLGEQSARFVLDVWVTDSAEHACAMLDARDGTLSTRRLEARTDLGAHARATSASGASAMVALAVENVLVIVRSTSGEDAMPLARQLAAAVRASSATRGLTLTAPSSLDATLRVQAPAGATDFRVTCDGACSARRVAGGFVVTRTTPGDAIIALHAVDAQLHATHVITTLADR